MPLPRTTVPPESITAQIVGPDDAPGSPFGPAGPRGSWPALKSFASSDPSFTSLVVTLFGGSLTAAYPVPPRATASAMHATTMAGDGLRILGTIHASFARGAKELRTRREEALVE